MTARTDGAMSSPASMHQRVQPQLARERWEASWMAQQREMNTVIRQDERSANDEAAQRSVALQATDYDHWNLAQARSREMAKSVSASAASNLGSSANSIHGAPNYDAPNHGAPKFASQIPAPFVVQSANLDGDHRDPYYQLTKTRVGATATSFELQQAAAWRKDDLVRVAMRLREPERDTPQILDVLRGWLKKAGLTLAGVMINGKARSLTAVVQSSSGTHGHNNRT